MLMLWIMSLSHTEPARCRSNLRCCCIGLH